jgi:hypothetical protein
MCVSRLVSSTTSEISSRTLDDSQSFAKVITSFTPVDIKPLASIHNITIRRKDVVNVLERAMDNSPESIIDTLPSWLASHRFDRNSDFYGTSNEAGFKYLASFATESVLEKALSIVSKNEHYRVDSLIGPMVWCCNSQKSIPHDLSSKLGALLALMRARNALVKGALSFIPEVLFKLLAEYITYETIDYSTSIPKTITGTKRKHH